MEAFGEKLRADLRALPDQIEVSALKTVFLGGGNPTAIGAEAFRGLMTATREIGAWTNVEEWTIESNPETLADVAIEADLGSLPGLRLSIGVQRFREDECRFLGRRTLANQVQSALEQAFRLTDNVGIDLILGLPGFPSLARDLEKMLAEFPLTHISAYFLSVEENTPLEKRLLAAEMAATATGTDAPAGGGDPAGIGPEELFEVADLLGEHGFEQYEIANFARSGRACRHNLGYWQGKDYLGLGPAAVSTVMPSRWKEAEDLEAWLRGEGRTVETLSACDQWREHLMLSLRLVGKGLDLELFQEQFGQDIPEDLLSRIATEVDRGFLLRAGSGVKLSRSGIAMANQVMSRLF